MGILYISCIHFVVDTKRFAKSSKVVASWILNKKKFSLHSCNLVNVIFIVLCNLWYRNNVIQYLVIINFLDKLNEIKKNRLTRLRDQLDAGSEGKLDQFICHFTLS